MHFKYCFLRGRGKQALYTLLVPFWKNISKSAKVCILFDLTCSILGLYLNTIIVNTCIIVSFGIGRKLETT